MVFHSPHIINSYVMSSVFSSFIDAWWLYADRWWWWWMIDWISCRSLALFFIIIILIEIFGVMMVHEGGGGFREFHSETIIRYIYVSLFIIYNNILFLQLYHCIFDAQGMRSVCVQMVFICSVELLFRKSSSLGEI